MAREMKDKRRQMPCTRGAAEHPDMMDTYAMHKHKRHINVLRALLIFLIAGLPLQAQTTIPAFSLEPNDLTMTRSARPNTYFDKVGRKFAMLGYESGTFEVWAYPLKLFRNVQLSFLIGSSTEPIKAADILRTISTTPEATVITYAFQSFTVKALFLAPVHEPGGYVLLDVHTTEPLTIICSFLPVLQPMWPAGIGGQSARWVDEIKAYRLSEPTRQNTAFIGSPAAEGISYTPAHMLSDRPNEFRIVIGDPAAVSGRFIPIVMAGGRGNRDSLEALYLRLVQEPEQQYAKAVQHFRNLRASTLRISTPVPEIDLAFEWAKVSFDNLFVDNPDVGSGIVAGLGTSGTGGRPGFGWFFGGDAYINSLSLNSYGGYGSTRDALRFTQKWQRTDGKMAHELTQAAAYVDWWNDYPYGYIHGDTSPYYICAVWDYFQHTADSAFVRSSWETLRKAYAWSRNTDANGDGFMDNKKAGLGALEYGPLTDIQSDIYTGAVWARAASVMPALARIAGDGQTAETTGAYASETKDAFDTLFWDDSNDRYAYAFTPDGNHVDIVSPWAAVGLMWKLGTEERSRKTLEELSTAELTTDWGIRSISEKSSYYEPLNYNYGAVWPFLSSWVATAQFTHHRGLQGYPTLLASVNHTFDNALGHVTEVFSGAANIWPGEAVAHQGFSSASVVLPLVRGLLGLEPDAPGRSFSFAPHFPADWKSVRIDGFTLGDATFSMSYTRMRTSIQLEIQTADGIGTNVSFAPSLGTGTIIRGVTIQGADVPFKETRSPQTVQPVVTTVLSAVTRIHIDISPTVELLPPPLLSRTGDRNLSLKIVKVERHGSELTAMVEGRSGHTYKVGVANADLMSEVEGCRFENGYLVIDFAPQKNDAYISRMIVIRSVSVPE